MCGGAEHHTQSCIKSAESSRTQAEDEHETYPDDVF
jgi:hypothetical protein